MPERSEEIDAPAADPPPLDCNNAPPTGEHAMLGGDSDIFVSFMNGNDTPELLVAWVNAPPGVWSLPFRRVFSSLTFLF